MPQFTPGELKSARAPITVLPSGLSCSAELYLVSNGAKVTTSGIKLFTSTGARQDISFPITMPGAEGTYPVYLDIFTNGLLIGAYKAVEDVVIVRLPTDSQMIEWELRYGLYGYLFGKAPEGLRRGECDWYYGGGRWLWICWTPTGIRTVRTSTWGPFE